jgi:predicted ATPase
MKAFRRASLACAIIARCWRFCDRVEHNKIINGAEQGVTFWHATSLLWKAGGLLQQGRLEESLSLLGKGLAAYRGTGAGLFLPNFLSILGYAYTQSGQFAEPREALDEGLAIAGKNDERSQEAELYRLQGELCLAETNDEAAAEECFQTAIATARRQHSKAWELRATTSLARLWQSYTEGFTMPDIMDAKVLLESVAKPGGL